MHSPRKLSRYARHLQENCWRVPATIFNIKVRGEILRLSNRENERVHRFGGEANFERVTGHGKLIAFGPARPNITKEEEKTCVECFSRIMLQILVHISYSRSHQLYAIENQRFWASLQRRGGKKRGKERAGEESEDVPSPGTRNQRWWLYNDTFCNLNTSPPLRLPSLTLFSKAAELVFFHACF